MTTTKRKRGNGDGSITQRPDGRFVARISIGDKRVSAYGRTREEAEFKLNMLKEKKEKSESLLINKDELIETLSKAVGRLSQENKELKQQLEEMLIATRVEIRERKPC